jgi:hypothetical protein
MDAVYSRYSVIPSLLALLQPFGSSQLRYYSLPQFPRRRKRMLFGPISAIVTGTPSSESVSSPEDCYKDPRLQLAKTAFKKHISQSVTTAS